MAAPLDTVVTRGAGARCNTGISRPVSANGPRKFVPEPTVRIRPPPSRLPRRHQHHAIAIHQQIQPRLGVEHRRKRPHRAQTRQIEQPPPVRQPACGSCLRIRSMALLSLRLRAPGGENHFSRRPRQLQRRMPADSLFAPVTSAIFPACEGISATVHFRDVV